MKKQLLVLVSILCVSFSAHSIVELRAGYGVNTPADDSVGTGTLSTMTGFNLDAIVEIPMVPVGLGLRYENMGLDYTSGGQTFDTDMTRMSLLVNYRIIDLFLYFGLIGTIGFQNDVTVKNVPLVGDLDYSSDLTYSAGVEGGFSFGLFMVGAELGYNIANYETDRAGFEDADFSGVYAKVLVGVGF